jgi:predicted AlkP superfamily phosphohydrolase/phosphomutase
MPGPDGHPLGNRVFVPQRLYRTVRGVAPDLIVYFGDLAWRAVGTVGGDGIFTLENDTGPDDANHAQRGLFIWHDPQRPGGGRRFDNVQIYDILPTLLRRFNISIPEGLRGTALEL